jgi:hypothetical protein
MDATSARHATTAASHEAVPGCPLCGTSMVVRSQWSAGHVTGLYWACRRAPGCEGVRRIKSPDLISPSNHDASAQAIFDWESSRDGSGYRHRAPAPPLPPSGIRALLGKLGGSRLDVDEPEWTPENGSVGHFDALVDHGFVILENRVLASARARIDNLLVGPSGVFVVERKSWPGQLVTTSDAVFVDGRQRIAATDHVLRAAAAFERTFDYELKPLGVTVRPALLFENAMNRHFEAGVGKVLVGGTRGLPRLIRGRAEPILGPETIVRLAVAADRLLE